MGSNAPSWEHKAHNMPRFPAAALALCSYLLGGSPHSFTDACQWLRSNRPEVPERAIVKVATRSIGRLRANDQIRLMWIDRKALWIETQAGRRIAGETAAATQAGERLRRRGTLEAERYAC